MTNILFDGYTARIGRGTSEMLGREAAAVGSKRAALVTDSMVPKAHIEKCLASLDAVGIEICVFALPAGERNKSLSTVEEVYGFLYDNDITRSDLLVGVGGGVVGDIAGFAAATYLRGLPFISVPTTLISATDSAYGGKVGVDFRGGKNHIGVFKNPNAVVCDVSFLDTLPKPEIANGMGEVIKYGLIGSKNILDSISVNIPDETIIAECVEIKRRFATADPFDRGERHILNFGHTYGHAVEEAANYAIPHGQAVAYGMLAMIRLGEKLGVTEEGVFDTAEAVIKKAGLDAGFMPRIMESLPYIKRDKKSDGKTVDAALIRKAGEPVRMKLALETLMNIS